MTVSDQALTGEVLKVSNSSFYKGLQQITTIAQAVIRLGINEVSNITTLITHKNHFRSNDPVLNDIMRNLWRHSVGCAVGSHWLATHCGLQGIKHESFFAGLLHDVGKLHILKIADNLKNNNGTGAQISNALLIEAMDTVTIPPDLDIPGDADSNRITDNGWYIRLVDSGVVEIGEKSLSKGIPFSGVCQGISLFAFYQHGRWVQP